LFLLYEQASDWITAQNCGGGEQSVSHWVRDVMPQGIKVLVSNRRARREYRISDTLEAGIVLVGTEVKSVRSGRVSLADAYCRVQSQEAFLVGAHISPYSHGNRNNHEPLRDRKLLLHKREIRNLRKQAEQKGATIIPLKMYLKEGRIKLQVGVAWGKRQYDKRADLAERDTKRQLERARKQY